MFISIIMIQLIDRVDEIRLLNEIYDSSGPSLFILYGRRRTGKTRLLLESIKSRNGLYYMAVESTLRENISSLSRKMGEFLKDDQFSRISYDGIEDILSEFIKKTESDSILLIDEFPNLFKYRPALLSELQRFWDHGTEGTDLKLVLCGSSISMMEQKVLSRSSPLYGRRSGQWKLQPLLPGYIKGFLPSFEIEDIVRTYGVCDGIPEYLLKFHNELSFEQNMDINVLRKGIPLSEEGKILLLLDLRNISSYVSIMGSISCGNSRLKDISTSTGLDKGMVSKYISNLLMIGYIEYLSPFGSTPRNRSGRYVLSDSYMDFYFRFLHRNASELEAGTMGFDTIRVDFERYLGPVFEKLIKKIISATGRFNTVSSWWHRGHEIDIVALDQKKKEILLGDIKWRNRKYSRKDLDTFLDHCLFFPEKKGYEVRRFMVSKSGFKDSVTEEMNNNRILSFDLAGIEANILGSKFDPRSC